MCVCEREREKGKEGGRERGRKERYELLSLLLFKKLINLFLAVLGLRCCARAFSSWGEQGLLFLAVRGLLIAVASLVAEHGL